MSFDLDRFNSTTLDIQLRAQPTSVQKTAEKRGTMDETLCITDHSGQPLLTVYVSISMV